MKNTLRRLTALLFVCLIVVTCFAAASRNWDWVGALIVGPSPTDLTTAPSGSVLVKVNSTGKLEVVGSLNITGNLTASNLTATTTGVSGSFNVANSLTVTNVSTLRRENTVDLFDDAYTILPTDYGTRIMLTTNGACAITLPTNGSPAGVWFEIGVHGACTDSAAPVYTAATADTLVGPGDPDFDSVTHPTGHRIGALLKFWSDGSFWHYQNLGGTTATATD